MKFSNKSICYNTWHYLNICYRTSSHLKKRLLEQNMQIIFEKYCTLQYFPPIYLNFWITSTQKKWSWVECRGKLLWKMLQLIMHSMEIIILNIRTHKDLIFHMLQLSQYLTWPWKSLKGVFAKMISATHMNKDENESKFSVPVRYKGGRNESHSTVAPLRIP